MFGKHGLGLLKCREVRRSRFDHPDLERELLEDSQFLNSHGDEYQKQYVSVQNVKSSYDFNQSRSE